MDSFVDRIKGYSPWALLPLLYSLSVAGGLFVVYFVALFRGEIVPLSTPEYNWNIPGVHPPFIGNAGRLPPAGCIFIGVMNLGAFVGFIIGIFRYRQLKNTLKMPWLNIISLLVFSCSCLGMTFVGNFMAPGVMNIHVIGTFLTFIPMAIYCWLQSFITLKVNLKNEGLKTSIFRFLLSAGITVCVILYFRLMSWANSMHVARDQWALVLLLLIFIGSFWIDFRHNHVEFIEMDDYDSESLTNDTMSSKQDLIIKMYGKEHYADKLPNTLSASDNKV